MRRLPLRIGVMLVFLIAAVGWVMRSHNLTLPGGKYQLVLNYPLQAADSASSGGKQSGDTKFAAGQDDANIAAVTAQLLQRSGYQRRPLDLDLSKIFLNEYYDALDPRHIYLLQSDIDEFNTSIPNLPKLLGKDGDTSLARSIFVRLLQRIDQQTSYVSDQLKNQAFTFADNDTYSVDRKDVPRPKDLDEAQQTWQKDLRYEYLQEKLNKQKADEIVKTLNRRYTRLARSMHELDGGDALELYLNALAHSYDPHSDYLGKSALEQFNTQMTLSLVGIGASLISEDGYAKIAELIPGGPAIKSGLFKAGDRITAVAQGDQQPVDVVDMKLDKVVDMIRGPKGTTVRLTIIPADATDPSTRKMISLVRDQVKLEEQEAKAEVIDIPAGNKTMRLGLIDLPSFYADSETGGGSHKSTTTDVARLLKKLEAVKVDGVILDLRRNPGGSLQEVIDTTGLFIKQGPVVQVKDPTDQIQVDDADHPQVVYNGPLIVLTSRFSASASEILAGALQDYDRALIVGDSSTFGKGTVQTLVPLKSVMQSNHIPVSTEPGDLKLTIQKFYRPSGSSTQLRGVASDIVLPSLTNYMDVGEKSLDHPLPWDTIPSAKFNRMNKVQLILPELKRRSDMRLANDKDFIYLRQEIDLFKKLQAEKSVSLNEEQRQKEKQDAEARAALRRKDLQTRTAPSAKFYLLTLENIDQPGLPAPTTWKKLTQAKAPAVKTTDDTSADTADQATPVIDPMLDETEHILLDMIQISPRPLVRTGQ